MKSGTRRVPSFRRGKYDSQITFPRNEILLSATWIWSREFIRAAHFSPFPDGSIYVYFEFRRKGWFSLLASIFLSLFFTFSFFFWFEDELGKEILLL